MRVLMCYTVQSARGPLDGHMFGDLPRLDEEHVTAFADGIEEFLRKNGESLTGKTVIRALVPLQPSPASALLPNAEPLLKKGHSSVTGNSHLGLENPARYDSDQRLLVPQGTFCFIPPRSGTTEYARCWLFQDEKWEAVHADMEWREVGLLELKVRAAP